MSIRIIGHQDGHRLYIDEGPAPLSDKWQSRISGGTIDSQHGNSSIEARRMERERKKADRERRKAAT